MQRSAVADEVDQEGQCYLAGQALLLQEESHVVQVPGVLAVEGRDQLTRVEVRQGQDRHFGEAETRLHLRARLTSLGWVDRAAQHRADLHLDLHRPVPDDQLDDVRRAAQDGGVNV